MPGGGGSGKHVHMFKHGDLNVTIFNDPGFFENGMLLSRAGRDECWIVDPGLPPQPQQISAAIDAKNLKPAAIVLTHCHADHMAGVGPLKEAYPDAEVLCPRGEEEMLSDPELNLSAPFGIPITGPPPDRLIDPGDELSFADLSWKAIDVRGHSPAGLAYYCAEVGVALVGDALFAEGIGRYDFPTSSRSRLIANIRDNLLTLPVETVIYPGHGPAATIKQILRSNMTLRAELEQ